MSKVVGDEICPLRAQVDWGGKEFPLYAPEALRFFFLLKGLNMFFHAYSSLFVTP
jgi:hypothetical protein